VAAGQVANAAQQTPLHVTRGDGQTQTPLLHSPSLLAENWQTVPFVLLPMPHWPPTHVATLQTCAAGGAGQVAADVHTHWLFVHVGSLAGH
jgi:hypothetical protein